MSDESYDRYAAGIREGVRRVLGRPGKEPTHGQLVLEHIVFELTLLRDVAKRLGQKADYWMAKSDEFELAAEYWHGVAASCGRELPR